MEVSGGIEALDADLAMAICVFSAAGEITAVTAAARAGFVVVACGGGWGF